MTVRGFLTWYLMTVAVVTASGASMWYGIQIRKNADTAAVAASPSEASPPSQQVADLQQTLPATSQGEAAPPELHPPQSSTATLPQLHVPRQTGGARLAVNGATQPWIAGRKSQPVQEVAPQAPTHRYPRIVVARGTGVHTDNESGSYVIAYPPAMPLWRMRRYAYYYPPYGYYPRYPYYYYSAD
jgi:hypothetical protein